MSEDTVVENVPERDGVEEKDYLLRRANQHRQLAEMSEESGSKHIHFKLASLYEDRASRVIVVDCD